MIKSRFGPGSDSDLVLCYCAAFRRALRLRRELSILARSSGVGGDRERIQSELALAVTAMNAAHDEMNRLIGTRIPASLSTR